MEFASKLVKLIFGKSMFFCFSAHTNSTIDFFVSRLSNMLFSDCRSLTLGEFKRNQKDAYCYLSSTSHLQHCKKESKSIGTISSFLAFIPILVLLEVYFVLDKLSKELEQTDPCYVNCLMTKKVIRDISCKPLGERKIILLYAVKFLSSEF